MIAQCTGVARNVGVEMFEEFELGPSNANTKCYNTIYEQFDTDADTIHVDCVGNKCTVTCRESGEPPMHVWPDGTTSSTSSFLCKAKTFWKPSKGVIRC